jgi:hypothetical protein
VGTSIVFVIPKANTMLSSGLAMVFVEDPKGIRNQTYDIPSMLYQILLLNSVLAGYKQVLGSNNVKDSVQNQSRIKKRWPSTGCTNAAWRYSSFSFNADRYFTD